MSRLVSDWGPVAVMAVVSFGASSKEFNADATQSVLVWLVGWLWPGQLEPDVLAAVHSLLRKTGHFLGYALIALCLARALRIPRPMGRGLLTLSLAAAWASLDEYHQTWTPMRTGALSDVVLDLLGALSAVAALAAIYVLRLSRARALARTI